MKFAVNTSSGVNNVTLRLKNFNITNETNLVNQGKIQNLRYKFMTTTYDTFEYFYTRFQIVLHLHFQLQCFFNKMSLHFLRGAKQSFSHAHSLQ